MDKLTVITPCTRLENLPAMAESIRPGRRLFELYWLVIFDMGEYPESRCGNDQRNSGLELVNEGWIYFLDDDNIIHPTFFDRLAQAIRQNPEAAGFLFRQDLGDNMMRKIIPQVNLIDMAQMVIQRELIGEEHFEPPPYNADGLFIENLYREHAERFILLDEVMSYYNRLRCGEH